MLEILCFREKRLEFSWLLSFPRVESSFCRSVNLDWVTERSITVTESEMMRRHSYRL